MSIYVLIICQVKSGKCSGDPTLRIENTIIPKINHFLRNFLNQPYNIEFLSAVNDNSLVDYNININDYNENLSFFQTHRNYYSLIILNGCTVKNIDFKNIYDLLCDNGLLIISNVKCSSRSFEKLNVSTISNLNDYFDFNQNFYIKKNLSVSTNNNLRISNENNNKINKSTTGNNYVPIANRTRSRKKPIKL